MMEDLRCRFGQKDLTQNATVVTTITDANKKIIASAKTPVI